MGAQLSIITPSAPTIAINSYTSELSNIHYEKTISNGRFLKTIKAASVDGKVIVKIFIKPDEGFKLDKIGKQLKKLRSKLLEIRGTVPYVGIVETERAGYLVKQYFCSNLYDRLSTRPFLELIDKKWMAFQLIKALSNCHSEDIIHGDIKLENIMVTSFNTIYLTDFSSILKPIFLPEDDPGLFSFYFDTSGRRCCYLAPERFEKRKMSNATSAIIEGDNNLNENDNSNSNDNQNQNQNQNQNNKIKIKIKITMKQLKEDQ